MRIRTQGWAVLALSVVIAQAGCGPSAPAPKVVVIGLDGATWDLLDPWMAAGDLPHLKALALGGAAGTLMSVFPPMSPPAWTTAVTGKNPGKHGIYDFWTLPEGETQFVPTTSLDRKAEAVWQTLSRHGRRVGILNVPLTDPPDEVNGFMVGGFPHLDEKGYAYPPDLLPRLERSGYQLDAYGEKMVEGREGELRAEILRTLEAQSKAALSLMESEPWDLFWVVFMATDKMQHFYWRFQDPGHPQYDAEKARLYGDTIRDLYRRVDRIVGDIVERAGKDAVVIVLSDHGFGPIEREIRLRPWFERERFTDWGRGVVLAYYEGDFGGQVYINLRGRDPRGQVEPGQAYLDLRSRIAERLMDLADPDTGVRPVCDVRFSEDVFSSPAAGRAPDIVFETIPGYLVVGGESGEGTPGPVFGPPSYSFSAYHRREGVVILSGNPVRKGVNLPALDLAGVTPTVLYLLGEALPADMDGTVFTPALTAECLVRHPVRFEDPVPLVRKNVPEHLSIQERRKALESVPYLR
jgi:predicted AlkP superfamily phosphohydrolase/phosphomutase